MAALTAARNTIREDDHVLPAVRSYPMAASTTIYPGAMVALNAAGYAKPAATGDTKVVGVYMGSDAIVNSGSAGALEVLVRRGAFWFGNKAGDLVTQALIATPALCYVEDDQTVRLTATASIVAGRPVRIDSAKGVLVEIN